MLLSTQTEFYTKNFGYEEGIRRISRMGFDYLDLTLTHLGKADSDPMLTDSYKEIAENIKKIALENGVSFNQCHAPYRFNNYNFFNDETAKKDIFFKIKRSIEIAGIVGAKAIVIHPWHHRNFHLESNDEFFKINMEFYGELAPEAHKAGVKIALENMWQKNIFSEKIVSDVCSNPYEFARYIDELNARYGGFVACLDIGHCALTGVDPKDSIKVLGSRIEALHVHDNNTEEDEHLLPFLGKINFLGVMEALKSIDYKGELTFEADKFLNKFPASHSEAVSAFMVKTGRKLISLFEK